MNGKPLTEEEKQALVRKINNQIKTYKITLYISIVLILVIIGIILIPACLIGISKQKKKLQLVNSGSLEVKSMSGVLSSKKVHAAKSPTLYLYYLDNELVPGDTTSMNIESGLQDRLGKRVTFEFIPSLSITRLYRDSDNHGYSFLTKQQF
jgi:hypothetical protein